MNGSTGMDTQLRPTTDPAVPKSPTLNKEMGGGNGPGPGPRARGSPSGALNKHNYQGEWRKFNGKEDNGTEGTGTGQQWPIWTTPE